MTLMQLNNLTSVSEADELLDFLHQKQIKGFFGITYSNKNNKIIAVPDMTLGSIVHSTTKVV